MAFKEQKKKEEGNEKNPEIRAKDVIFLHSKQGMCLHVGKLGRTSPVTVIAALQRNKYYPSKFVRLNGTCPSC